MGDREVGRKVEWLLCHFPWRGSLTQRRVDLRPAVCMATIDMGGKWGGGCCAPLFGELGPIYRHVAWAETYIHTKWHLDPCSRLATIHMGRKVGGGLLCPLVGGEIGPHLTESAGHTVLDRVASWSNQLFGTIHQRHRQDRTGRQRSDSIGRTVLQTVALNTIHKNNFTCTIATWRDNGICISAINSVGLPHPLRSNLTPAYVPILYHFRDRARYLSKIADFLTPPAFRTLLGISPKSLHHKSTPCMLACRVDCVTLGSVALAQYQRMKDRETEMPQQYPAI